MWKKSLMALRDLALHFLVYFCVAYLFNKIWGLENELWVLACGLSLGWLLWEFLKYGYKKMRKKSE